jgi:hypothetical protein
LLLMPGVAMSSGGKRKRKQVLSLPCSPADFLSTPLSFEMAGKQF